MTNQILLKQVEKGSNFVSSPLSLHVMLSLVAAGSTGQTLEQLLGFLGSKSIAELNQLSSQINNLVSLVEGAETANEPTTGTPTLLFVNGVWVEKSFGLKPSFEEIASDTYKAKTELVDFTNKADEVLLEVNSWAERATRGLIKGLLPSGYVDCNTALVLANALYFKGAWDQQFDTSKTEHRDFHFLDGHIVQVPFMTGKKYEQYLYRDCDGYRVLQLPYQSGQSTRQFSMFFFLPDKKDGLLNLVKMLNSKPGFFNQQFDLQSRVELPDFWIPRFKFSYHFEASETLKEMGLQLPFYPGELGEMVNSSNSENLYLSKVFQKAYIEVNEEGTEAAASTAATMRWCSASYPTPSFVADHPFMFMIREETTRTVLFTGAEFSQVVTQLLCREKQTFEGLRPQDDLSRFKKPELLFSLIHFILFQLRK
ncbi:unnamed protein product [Dovyalis caffra]|uniref:Serpin domain-containing protein n=1 Tax=Dovyalis caffra TaxID=77055 RepID=A0AAV1RFQ9_9ROSI|nr:unnamed protein product [Dovyalis caffra]